MFKNKLVAIMNQSIEPGVAMNALAHTSLGFGASLGTEPLELVDYIDQDGNTYPYISKMPFIILKTSGAKIRALKVAALEAGVRCSFFTNTMTVGSWDEQLARTKETKEEDLIYYSAVLFGEWNTVTALTKKFSLFR